jgi:hypothetical protein
MEEADQTGVLKFNGLLEWLQGHLPGSVKPKKAVKSDSKAKSDRGNARKAEQALEQEKARDATGTKDAAPAEPEEVAAEAIMKDMPNSVPADPYPEEEVIGDTGDAGIPKTMSHEEL